MERNQQKIIRKLRTLGKYGKKKLASPLHTSTSNTANSKGFLLSRTSASAAWPLAWRKHHRHWNQLMCENEGNRYEITLEVHGLLSIEHLNAFKRSNSACLSLESFQFRQGLATQTHTHSFTIPLVSGGSHGPHKYTWPGGATSVKSQRILHISWVAKKTYVDRVGIDSCGKSHEPPDLNPVDPHWSSLVFFCSISSWSCTLEDARHCTKLWFMCNNSILWNIILHSSTEWEYITNVCRLNLFTFTTQLNLLFPNNNYIYQHPKLVSGKKKLAPHPRLCWILGRYCAIS